MGKKMRKKKVQFPDYEYYFVVPSLSNKEVCCLVSHIWPEDPFLEISHFGGNDEGDLNDFVNGIGLTTRLYKVGNYFSRLLNSDTALLRQEKNGAFLTIDILDRMTKCPDAAPQFLEAYSAYRKKSFGAHVGWEGFDPDDPCYPVELDIAFNAWRAVSKKPNKKEPVKRQIQQWLKAHHPELVAAQIERISTLVNWEKAGGRPSKE